MPIRCKSLLRVGSLTPTRSTKRHISLSVTAGERAPSPSGSRGRSSSAPASTGRCYLIVALESFLQYRVTFFLPFVVSRLVPALPAVGERFRGRRLCLAFRANSGVDPQVLASRGLDAVRLVRIVPHLQRAGIHIS